MACALELALAGRRMKPGLGLKRQPKQRQGLSQTCSTEKKEPAAAAAAPAAEPETIDLS